MSYNVAKKSTMTLSARRRWFFKKGGVALGLWPNWKSVHTLSRFEKDLCTLGKSGLSLFSLLTAIYDRLEQRSQVLCLILTLFVQRNLLFPKPWAVHASLEGERLRNGYAPTLSPPSQSKLHSVGNDNRGTSHYSPEIVLRTPGGGVGSSPPAVPSAREPVAHFTVSPAFICWREKLS